MWVSGKADYLLRIGALKEVDFEYLAEILKLYRPCEDMKHCFTRNNRSLHLRTRHLGITASAANSQPKC